MYLEKIFTRIITPKILIIQYQKAKLVKKLTREETIEWLLLTFNDAREPLRTGDGGGSGKGGFESRELRMPASWTPSYRKLEDALRELRAEDSILYWHVSERYLRCRKATITIVVERKTSRGVLREPRRVVVELWNPGVKMTQVKAAIVWLSGHITGEVWLPKDIIEVASS